MRQPRKNKILRHGLGAALALVVLATLAPHAAVAQPRDPNMVRVELERTNELLQRAHDVVRRSGNPRAMADLQLAVRVQESAWEHFRAQQWILAVEKTMQARNLGQRAVHQAQQQGTLEQRALRVLEDAQQKLDRSRDCLGDPPSETAMRLRALAAARLEQAREAFHELKYQVAIDIAMQVHRMLDELCSRRPVQHVEQLLESVRRLIERASQDLEACDPAARAHLDRARERLARAEDMQRAGNPLAAAQNAQQAKELALRALRACERQPDAADIDGILEETAEHLQDLAARLHDSGHPEAMRVMERALEHLEKARRLHQDGRLRQALAEVRVARNLARRAAQMAGIRG